MNKLLSNTSLMVRISKNEKRIKELKEQIVVLERELRRAKKAAGVEEIKKAKTPLLRREQLELPLP